jgi:hypothetical protein
MKPIQLTWTTWEYIIARDTNDDILWMQWTTVPTDTTTWFAKWCIFLDTDVATWTSWVYFNKWTNTSCVFELAPVASTWSVTDLTVSWKIVNSWITETSGADAVALTGAIHEVTTTWTGDALTLANWTAGQKLTILYVAEWAGADTWVLTPTTLAWGSTITFNTLWDSCDLTYSATWGWYMTWWTAVVA